MRLPGWMFDTPCVLTVSAADVVPGATMSTAGEGSSLADGAAADVFRGMCMLYEQGASAVKKDALEGSVTAKALLQDADADLERFSDGWCALGEGAEDACLMRVARVRRVRLPGARRMFVLLELMACG